ncbi:MAG TPA: hypothetical protein GX694_10455 [Actinomycetales bacterium]|nr:hypothetical protein [Actinomycetales bacterium]
MRGRRTRAALAALAALPLLLTACSADPSADGPETVVATTTPGKPMEPADADPGDDPGDEYAGDASQESASALPRGEDDPCDPTWTDTSYRNACETVGWVDLDGDGTAEPIALSAEGGPELRISTVVDGEWIGGRLQPQPPGNPPLGPRAGALDEVLHAAFHGAYDLAGDGSPKLVVWSHESDGHNEFRVFHFSGTDLVPVASPTAGMYNGGNNWAHHHYTAHPGFRCTGDPEAGLESIHANPGGGEILVTRYAFTSGPAMFDQVGDTTRGTYSPRPTDDLGIDCMDLAEHAR